MGEKSCGLMNIYIINIDCYDLTEGTDTSGYFSVNVSKGVGQSVKTTVARWGRRWSHRNGWYC
jgi:hypothetical protein